MEKFPAQLTSSDFPLHYLAEKDLSLCVITFSHIPQKFRRPGSAWELPHYSKTSFFLNDAGEGHKFCLMVIERMKGDHGEIIQHKKKIRVFLNVAFSEVAFHIRIHITHPVI